MSNSGRSSTVGIVPSGAGHLQIAVTSWAGDFVFAGTSAALLLIINLFPNFWFLSFLALLPFIYRSSRSSVRHALRMGLIFGVTYFLNAEINTLTIDPGAALLNLFAGIALAGILGLAIGFAGRRWGTNPVLMALIWTGFQFACIRLTGVGTFFGNIEITLPLFRTLSALFGFIIVSLIIVLANTLLLWAVEKALDGAGGIARYYCHDEKSWELTQYIYNGPGIETLVQNNRAPPLFDPL